MRKSFIILCLVMLSILLLSLGCSSNTVGMENTVGDDLENEGFDNEGETGGFWSYRISNDPNEIVYGETKTSYYVKNLEGELDDNFIYYHFIGEYGDNIKIKLESDYFDTYLNLIDEEHQILETDDNSGEGTNSMIEYTLPYFGLNKYIIAVSSSPKFQGEIDNGEFRLSLILVE
jgi:hypothetical protein